MKIKNKIYLISAIFGLIIVLLIAVIIICFKEIKNQSKELVSIKKELVLMNNQSKEIENFRAAYKNYQPNLDKINNLFIDLKNPVGFIQFLEKTISECGISAEFSLLTSPQIKTGNETWPSVVLQVKGFSSFPKFLKFSEKLETSPYLVKFQNLNINRISEKNIKTEEKYSIGDTTFILSMKAFTK